MYAPVQCGGDPDGPQKLTAYDFALKKDGTARTYSPRKALQNIGPDGKFISQSEPDSPVSASPTPESKKRKRTFDPFQEGTVKANPLYMKKAILNMVDDKAKITAQDLGGKRMSKNWKTAIDVGFQRTEAELEFDKRVSEILQAEKAKREVLEQEERTIRKQALALQLQNQAFHKWFEDRGLPLPAGCEVPDFHINQSIPCNAVAKQRAKAKATVNNNPEDGP